MSSTALKRLYALVDCNNFYVSCERVFAPALRHRPVAVLSNNDGCVVARSDELKRMGIARGTPFFRCRAALERAGGAWRSSNYTLYADMSARVMEVLRRFSPEVEEYSIDEAFLLLPPGTDPHAWGAAVRERVTRLTGIAVSVGIGETRTRAKLAAGFAKQGAAGVALFAEPMLARTAVGDVWGIGYRHARRLAGRGITTAADFLGLPEAWIRKKMTITGLYVYWELSGRPCAALQEEPSPRKSILSSRSFGHPVVLREEVEEAIASHIALAAGKLRAQGGLAEAVTVFLTTNGYREGPQYANTATVVFPLPTDYTPRLLKAALACLRGIYRDGYAYKKAGVLFPLLAVRSSRQLSLLDDPAALEAEEARMQVLDALRYRHSCRLYYAAEGRERDWAMKREFLSPCYTTAWDALPGCR